MAQDSVSLPMSGAGIVGLSPGMKLSGFEIEPKHLIIATGIFIILVNVATIVKS